MKYTTAYDIGVQKRKRNGINEDSVAVTIYADGHRKGYDPGWRTHASSDESALEEQSRDGSGSQSSADEASVFALDSDDGNTDSQSERRDRTAGIFVLADGAGGEDAGDIASYIATTVVPGELATLIQEALRANTDPFGIDIETSLLSDPPAADEVEHAIAEAINEANKEIVRYANDAGADGMYTTIVVGVKLGSQLHYGWVGDSRAYVINEEHSEIALLTKDHAEVQRLEDQGKIDEIEGHVHPDGNRIDRAVGGGAGQDPSAAQVRTDTATVQLYSDDTVLFTSDGLIDAQTDAKELYYEYKKSGEDEEVGERVLEQVVTDADIRDIVLESQDIGAAAQEFVEFSNEKGGKDNISIILFNDDLLPSSPPADGGLPKREYDPDVELAERETVVDS